MIIVFEVNYERLNKNFIFWMFTINDKKVVISIPPQFLRPTVEYTMASIYLTADLNI